MDKGLLTTMLIVISMVVGILLFNTVYPAVTESSSTMEIMTHQTEDRLKSQISIVHATGELDGSGSWQDTNSNSLFEVFAWTKNIGTTRIVPVEGSDIFFGPEGNFVRIPHQSNAGGGYPYWSYEVENATEWTPTATVKITIFYQSALSTGRYYLKITTFNGIVEEYIFSM